MIPIIVFLTLAASLSPLLTLLALWQQKEWRWDRLSEHLKKEGVITQLYGKTRRKIYIILVIVLIIFALTRSESRASIDSIVAYGSLTCLIMLNAYQIARKKQPVPKMTPKTLAMVFVSLGMITGITVALLSTSIDILPYTSIVIVLLPVIVAAAWILLLPVDRWMKARTMQRAKKWRSMHPDIIIIGITGSVGKTTTKELLAHILEDRSPIVTPLHVNTEMGIAQWIIEHVQKKDITKETIMIIEMGAYRLGEIGLICDMVKPNIGIVTRVGEEHLGLFGSRKNILMAKSELLMSLPENGHAFLNADDENFPALKERCHASSIVSVTTGSHGDVRALDIEEDVTGLRFTIDTVQCTLRIQGTHNCSNALLAIACAKHCGMTLKKIKEKLQTFSLLPNTFNTRIENGITILDATYNASPQSFQAAIEWAERQPQKEKILCTAGIIELGEEEEKIHTKLGMRAAKVFDRLYVTSPRFLPYFQTSFQSRATLCSRRGKPMKEGSLLVCIGRISQANIQALLS